MRLVLIAASCMTLGGCFFFYIPGSLFQSGNTCVEPRAYVGQRIRHNQTGKTGTVKEVYGPTDRCTSAMPLAAQVEYD